MLRFGTIYIIYNGIGNDDTIEIDEEILVSSNSEDESNINESSEEEEIVIYITGAVENPGVVRLKEGSRIEDAIEAAGGLLDTADISQVNLAYVLEDGIKLRVPYLDDEEDIDEEILTDDSGENIIENTGSTSSSKININKASADELEQLPGIGESIASKIVTYREENGDFSTIEDIKNVNGIGDNKYENIKDLICVK